MNAGDARLLREHFAGITKALLVLSKDCGGISADRTEAQVLEEIEQWLHEPEHDGRDLEKISKWLSGLSDVDLDTVCCGELRDIERILMSAPHGTDALLEQWFEEKA